MRLINIYTFLVTVFFALSISANAGSDVVVSNQNEAPAVIKDLRALRRASRSKRPKFKKRPRPHPQRPHHHPKDCTNTDLVKNGDFQRNVKGWQYIRGSFTQFFWVKDSKKRPAHSGSGQGYLFLNRGYSSGFLITTIPAVEYGNSITVSAWLRYEPPADLSNCFIIFTDNTDVSIDLTLTPKWTKYSFETPGTGRAKELQFRIRCESNLPVSIFLDDVSATACVPRNPNPECQVLPGADNFLVNPGFECPDGITAWTGSSYFGNGNESIAQFSGSRANPTHSGNGMAGLLLDASQVPYSGVAVYQWNVEDNMSRTTVKASFWLSVDSKLNNVAGCMLNVGTNTGYYLRDVDISYLTTKWTKIEIKDIYPTTGDTFEISVSQCTSSIQPLIYLDDVYFGIDRAAPPLPTTTTVPEPTSTPTAGPCTTTPFLQDPSFELGDLSNWLFFDSSPNYDTMFFPDVQSTYGPPHAGSAVGVLDFPSSGGTTTLMQQVFGLCNGQAYTGTVWFYIPTGYDASLCTFSLGFFAGSGPVKPTASGVWTKVEVVFLASLDSTSIYPYAYVGVHCENQSEMIVLVDDITFGPPPACNTSPAISDGSFESGNLTIWDPGFAEGDETFTITTAKPRTGKKSAVFTFPSTSNGAGLSREFDTCVGKKYTFRLWYFVPETYKGIQCFISAYAWYTGENFYDEITVYNSWVEAKLDFAAGAVRGHIDFGVSCFNQLRKFVIYLDDVSVSIA